jgi:hypothetical protein
MPKVDFRKIFTYGLVGVSGIAWGLTFLFFAYFLMHFLSSSYVVGITPSIRRLAMIIGFMFVLPAVMTFLSIWLPLHLGRQNKATSALLFAIFAALLWIPYAMHLFMHIAVGV